MTSAERYQVHIKRSAERDMDRLRGQAFQRVAAAILALEANPRPRGCQRLRGAEGQYRIRVGDYRVLYFVEDSNRTVGIVAVGHRRDVYRGL